MVLDLVCKRYGVTPSQLLESGDTLDVDCALFGLGWESWKQTAAMQQNNTPKNNNHGLSQSQMQAMIDRVKGKKDDSNSRQNSI